MDISDPQHTECSNLKKVRWAQHIFFYVHFPFMRFEHSVCRGSLMATYIKILAWSVEHSLLHWCRQCVTVRHVPKCMSCHEAIVVITERTHSFRGCQLFSSSV